MGYSPTSALHNSIPRRGSDMRRLLRGYAARCCTCSCVTRCGRAHERGWASERVLDMRRAAVWR